MFGIQGIAYTLNRGMQTALSAGCTRVLTMDQDNCFQTDSRVGELLLYC